MRLSNHPSHLNRFVFTQNHGRNWLYGKQARTFCQLGRGGGLLALVQKRKLLSTD